MFRTILVYMGHKSALYAVTITSLAAQLSTKNVSDILFTELVTMSIKEQKYLFVEYIYYHIFFQTKMCTHTILPYILACLDAFFSRYILYFFKLFLQLIFSIELGHSVTERYIKPGQWTEEFWPMVRSNLHADNWYWDDWDSTEEQQ